MKLTKYLKTRCPHCNSDKHVCNGKRKHGIVIIRYHVCEVCERRFKSEQMVFEQ